MGMLEDDLSEFPPAYTPEAVHAMIPLAPPKPPMVFGSTTLRIAHRPPEDGTAPIEAIEVLLEPLTAAGLRAAMKPGLVEVSIVNAFGASRTLQLDAAELMMLLGLAERFVQELPK